MNKKSKRISFIISFIPYILLILTGMYYSIFGYQGMFSNTLYYGWSGFEMSVFWITLAFTLQIPILPLCIIWQIIYLIVRHKEKRGNNDNRKNKIK